MSRWHEAAISFALEAASVLTFPFVEPAKAAFAGVQLLAKIKENKAAIGLGDRALIERTQADILDGWRQEAQGDWLTKADAEAADALLDRHLAASLPSLREMAGLAGTANRTEAIVALAVEKLEAKDIQFRDNPLIRRFAEEVLILIVTQVRTRPEFRHLLVTYDVEEIARGQQEDRVRDEAHQTEVRAILHELLERSDQSQAAIQQGIDPEVIIDIARRLAPQVDNAQQALLALDRAAEELLRLRAERAAGSNLGKLVDDVVRRISERIEARDLEGAQAEGVHAFAEWRRRREETALREAERLANEQATGTKLAQENERVAYLAGHAAGVAGWIAERLALEAGASDAPLALLDLAHTEWWKRGENLGLSIDLEVAAEIARLALARPEISADNQCIWLNNLALVLAVSGERQVGTTQLEEAGRLLKSIIAQRRVILTPYDWATMHTNLGNVLRAVGKRKADLTRMEEAISAQRIAVSTFKSSFGPSEWIGAENNLGTALLELGRSTNNGEVLKQACDAFTNALLALDRQSDPLMWAATKANLGSALRSLGDVEEDTTRLEGAIEAYRDALLEQTRECVPLAWAKTQNNLGVALMSLGRRLKEVSLLEDAVTAYHNALLERRRERVPLDWASTKLNLCFARGLIAGRQGDGSSLAALQRQAQDARQQLIDGDHALSRSLGDDVVEMLTLLEQRLGS